MKKTVVTGLIAIMIILITHCGVMANDAGLVVDEDHITISLANTNLQVDEEIKLTNTNKGNETISILRFWIQQDIQDELKITEKQSGKTLTPIITGNIRTCNLSETNLSLISNESMNLHLTYHLPINTLNYIKTIMYNTTFISITYENRELFQGKQLYNSIGNGNNEIQVRLYNPTEAPLNITMIILIFAIAIIVLTILLVLLKKQRSKTKKTIAESEETLTTKKTLLLSLLKDLEKQYRVHSISNDTYIKIKDEYKQQTVDVMKKLDDLKK